MIEHHVEKAFRDHAELCKCENFKIARRDAPDLGFVDQINTRRADIELTGEYVWCGRQFHFQCHIYDGGFAGTVIVQAFTRRPVLLPTAEAASFLMAKFPGYGLNVHAPTVPGKENIGEMFWGIATRVCDIGFAEITVNAISCRLDEALASWEDEGSEEAAA
jgi:hypothetical protein